MTTIAYASGLQSVDVDAAGVATLEIVVGVFDTTAMPTLVGSGTKQFTCDALTPDGDLRALARQAAQEYAAVAFNTAVPIDHVRMPVLY